MAKIEEKFRNNASYHLYKSDQERNIILTDPVDYVFKYVDIMPFKDIIVQICNENPNLLPNKGKFSDKIQDLWMLYKKLKEE